MNDQSDFRVTNPTRAESFNEISERRLTRRGFVKSGVAVGVGAALMQLSGCGSDHQEEVAQEENRWREGNPIIQPLILRR